MTNAATPEWLVIERGRVPLVLSLPHTGSDWPQPLAAGWVSPWRATQDADWHVEKLYSFAADLGVTCVRTRLSRSVIDVNRDPSGRSLYPGMATTELCPTTTFDGEPLYRAGHLPDVAEIARRRTAFFDPYHAALRAELTRLRATSPRVVLFDAHSIRSRVPRLFDGELPVLNWGTNSGKSCALALSDRLLAISERSTFSVVRDARFKGGYITRAYGDPQRGVHAVQLELACRGYLREPADKVDESNWPVAYDADYARPLAATLQTLLTACIEFALRSNEEAV